jgi:hypothetical protein
MSGKPEELIARITPAATAFANAVHAEGKGFAAIRFEHGIAIFCLDVVPGADGIKEALTKMLKMNEGKNIIGSGEMNLS